MTTTPLVEIADVRALAARKNINLETYNDAEIQSLIDIAKDYLEVETGRIFDEQAKTDTTLNFTGPNYPTKYWPIISVEEVKTEDSVLDPSAYDVWFDMGIIMLETGYKEPYKIEVEYTAGYVVPHKAAKAVCLDLILDTIKSNALSYDGVLSSIAEGSTKITIDTSKKSLFSIEDRIAKLRSIRIKQV